MFKTNPALFFLIACGTVFFIIALNISLFSWVKDHSLEKQIKMTKSVFHRVQSPFEPEENDLSELSHLVEGIRQEEHRPSQSPDKPE
jgi:hypothetical protein